MPEPDPGAAQAYTAASSCARAVGEELELGGDPKANLEGPPPVAAVLTRIGGL